MPPLRRCCSSFYRQPLACLIPRTCASAGQSPGSARSCGGLRCLRWAVPERLESGKTHRRQERPGDSDPREARLASPAQIARAWQGNADLQRRRALLSGARACRRGAGHGKHGARVQQDSAPIELAAWRTCARRSQVPLSLTAIDSSAAAPHLSSLSGPEAPETPIAPMTDSPDLMG